ncbi:hypothetical protein [Flavobacterium sp.]|uniref:hypothetical protein n=1 Tax=Flavobacterium sp. TaxID=239 RepID=UPI003C531E49
MKNIKSKVFIMLFLVTITTVSAQYGNGYGSNYGNGYGGGGYGRQRLDSDLRNNEPEKPKEIPVEETVAEIMKKMKPELKLDALQEIAISNVMKETIRDQGIIIKDEKVGQEQKSKEIQALSETTTRKINEYLNPDQKVIYKEWIENQQGKGSKKSRKTRKEK